MPSVVIPTTGEETYGSVSTLDDSAFGQCLNGTVEVISELNLSSIFYERIHLRWTSYLRTDGSGKILDTLPCIIVSPYAIRPADVRGSNKDTAVWYVVNVAIHRAGGVEQINQMGACLLALQEIYRAFSKKPARSLGFEVSDDMLLESVVDSAEADNERLRELGILVQFVRPSFLVRLPYEEVL